MKKLLALFLALVMTFSMCACEKLEKLEDLELPPLPTVAPEETPAPEVKAAAETPAPTKAPKAKETLSNHVIVSMNSTVLQEYDPADGKELILTFAYESPTVYIEGRDEASKAINEYLAMLDETYYTGNDYGAGAATGFNMMLELALDNYGYVVGTGAEGINLEFSSHRTTTVSRADNKVLSLVFNETVYTGGAGENNFDRGYVFDTETGATLSLESLSADYDSLRSFLVDYMVNAVKNNKKLAESIDEDAVPEEDYTEAFSHIVRDGSWYLNAEGLVIFTDENEFGPGYLEFKLSYDELSGVIDNKWIPAEKEGLGRFELKLQSDVADGSMEITDRLVADAEGTELCLIADGTLYEVNIARVEYVDKFFETAQLWHCSYMSDCALQLVTDIPDGMPNLMISYLDAEGEEHSLLITQSGKDGSLILSDDDIEAVG